MLDTIRVSILDFTNDKISKENGWGTTKKGLIYDYKKIKLANVKFDKNGTLLRDFAGLFESLNILDKI